MVDDPLLVWFRQTALFGGMQSEVIHLLLQKVRWRYLPSLSYLLSQGELTTSVYLIYAGKFVVQQTREGCTYDLRYLVSGDCVGELALLGCLPRSASVQAVEESEVFELALADID